MKLNVGQREGLRKNILVKPKNFVYRFQFEVREFVYFYLQGKSLMMNIK